MKPMGKKAFKRKLNELRQPFIYREKKDRDGKVIEIKIIVFATENI